IVADTMKYTYSGDTMGAGTNLTLARSLMGAASNPTLGIFGAGSTSGSYPLNSDRYTFAGDTVVAGTNFGIQRNDLSATSSRPGGF
ncbi:MAG: hypothetical protein AB7P49_17790, partial [Bdellovibrionales bacterium]